MSNGTKMKINFHFMKKNNLFLLCFILFFLFVFSVNFVLALEIKDYPRVPGLPPITDTSNLGEYTGYFIGLFLYLAGAIAVISFAIGAVGLIISGDSPESASSAKDRMKGALLGLFLTVSSVVILQTINPALVNPVLNPLPGVEGVYYTNGSEFKPVGIEEINTSNRPENFNSIIYRCLNKDEAPPLLIWTFPNPGLENGNGDLSSVNVIRKTCGDSQEISGFGSFRIAYEVPGVYYFLKAGCSGYASTSYNYSQDEIIPIFKDNIKSIRIINNPEAEIFYGAIFHEAAGLRSGGKCNLPIISAASDETCRNINLSSPKAVDIFTLDWDDWGGGDGVDFYSEPYGPNRGARAGFYKVAKDEVDPTGYLDPDDMEFNYEGIDVPEAYKDRNKTFKDRPGSIDAKGDYLIALYSKDTVNYGDPSAWYCQTFTDDVPNLNAQPFVAAGSNYIDRVYIIPTE